MTGPRRVGGAWPATVAVALLAALFAGLVVACGVPNDGEPRGVASEDVPVGLLSPPTTQPLDVEGTAPGLFPTTQPVAAPRIRMYLVLEKEDRVVPVDRVQTAAVAPDAAVVVVAQAAADVLLQSPFLAERALGLTTTLSSTTIRCLRVDEGTLDIEVSQLPQVLSAQPLAMAQIVLTLTLVDGVNKVRVFRDGDEVFRVPLWIGEAEPGAEVDRSDYLGAIGSFASTDTTTTTVPTTTAPAPTTAAVPVETTVAPPEQTPATEQPAPPAEEAPS